jgi:hypothetical protein
MHTGAKVNLFKYTLLSLLLLGLAFFLARSNDERFVMLIVFSAACLNQWMLVNVVRGVTQNAADGTPVDKGNMVMMTIGKLLLVVTALSFGVHIMGNRIIIPVLIYVLQIAVLYLSFDKRIDQTGAEKGSK